MGEYDRNCIVVCLEEVDKIPTRQTQGADALMTKLQKNGHKNCSQFLMPADPKKKTMLEKFDSDIAKLTGESRLYILGECVHPSGSLSGMAPGHLAERLVQNYGLRGAKKIVLVACEAGGLPNDFRDWSFAKAFHHILRKPFGIHTVVAAYNRPVFIITEDYAKQLPTGVDQDWQVGAKLVEGFPASMKHGVRTESGKSQPIRPFWDEDSKILWFWEGDEQKFVSWYRDHPK
jgi:hypothetical protein